MTKLLWAHVFLSRARGIIREVYNVDTYILLVSFGGQLEVPEGYKESRTIVLVRIDTPLR